MTITTNLNGTTRKNLATLIAEQLGRTAKYCGAPSFAYEAGPATIGKDGTVTFTEDTAVTTIRSLLDALDVAGIEYDRPTELVNETPDDVTLLISYPMNILTDDGLRNLKAIIEAKGALIKKALGVAELPLLETEEAVAFPWFTGEITPEAFKAYGNFITALCDMAKNQKRVTAKEKPVDNDKYAFRCFLLRLGFIGDEYKTVRKVLLQNLSGSTAFRNDKEKYAPGLDPIPTPENTVEFNVAEAMRRLQEPQVQAEIRAIMNED